MKYPLEPNTNNEVWAKLEESLVGGDKYLIVRESEFCDPTLEINRSVDLIEKFISDLKECEIACVLMSRGRTPVGPHFFGTVRSGYFRVDYILCEYEARLDCKQFCSSVFTEVALNYFFKTGACREIEFPAAPGITVGAELSSVVFNGRLRVSK